MRTKKLTNDELVTAIINKQLEPFGKTIDDVRSDPDWLGKFEVSEQEQQEWIDWSTNFIKKNAKSSYARTRAKEEMAWINLNWGLPIIGARAYDKFEKYPRVNPQSSTTS